MKKLVWILVAALFILHQDFWWWDDRTLVFGFMPVGLFYHAIFSLAAAGVWALALRFAWPSHIEEWADALDAPASSGGRR
jgi:hypothetical protein